MSLEDEKHVGCINQLCLKGILLTGRLNDWRLNKLELAGFAYVFYFEKGHFGDLENAGLELLS